MKNNETANLVPAPRDKDMPEKSVFLPETKEVEIFVNNIEKSTSDITMLAGVLQRFARGRKNLLNQAPKSFTERELGTFNAKLRVLYDLSPQNSGGALGEKVEMEILNAGIDFFKNFCSCLNAGKKGNLILNTYANRVLSCLLGVKQESACTISVKSIKPEVKKGSNFLYKGSGLAGGNNKKGCAFFKGMPLKNNSGDAGSCRVLQKKF